MQFRRKNKNGKRDVTIFGITSRALMLIAAGLLVMSYISMFFNPAKAWFMTVFGLMFFPFLFLNLFLLIWALLRRSKAGFIPLMAMIPAVILFGRYIQFSKPDFEENGNVRIISYNVGKFSMYGKRYGFQSSDECRDSLMSFLKQQNADIICLQEFAMSSAKEVRPYLEEFFPGYDIEYYVYTNDKGCYGNVTLSKFPILGKGKLDFEQSSNLALYCDYEIDTVRLRIYNCHFQSYNISLSHLAQSLKNKKEFKHTEAKVKMSIVRRPKQVDMVIDDIENCPLESLVAGDFNDNPMSYTYYKLAKGRKDTFVQAGKGAGATYSLMWPLLRIDYILYPERFLATDHKVIKERFSDHYPIMAELKI